MSEKKKKKRVGSIIFRIILILIAGLTVGIGVFSWNASGLVGNQLPMPFGFGVSVVLSPSMEPVLNTNDLVFVTEQDDYKVDDIVVYQEGSMLVIHRIVSINDDTGTVITKGDANASADDPISKEDIKAKLAFRIPFVGLIFKYLKTVPGTLIVLAIAIYFLYKSRRKEQEADREELDDIVDEINRLRESISQQKNGSAESKDPSDSDSTESKPTEDPSQDSEESEQSNDPDPDSDSSDNGDDSDQDTAEESDDSVSNEADSSDDDTSDEGSSDEDTSDDGSSDEDSSDEDSSEQDESQEVETNQQSD